MLTAVCLIDWDSMAAHEKINSDQETLLTFFKLFESSAEGGIPKGTVIHAAWEEDTAVPCLKAPFVELKRISPRSGVTVGAIQRVLDKYIAYMNDPSSGAIGATYGPVVEVPDQFLLIVGRKSTEVECILVSVWARTKIGQC
jgi:hypothetical protein